MAGIEGYSYKPLEDSNTHIRLLHAEAVDDDSLTFTTSTWSLEHLPAYVAISYTWGEATLRSRVIIDGQECKVRENAWYALWQVVNQLQTNVGGAEHVWLDAICIDQEALAEKGDQVNVMGEIFARAELVFACVGSHYRDSKILMETLKCLEEDDEERNLSAKKELFDGLRGWTSAVSASDCIWSFAGRAYWKRLWIVQEIFRAREVHVLCGDSALSFRELAKTCSPSQMIPANERDVLNFNWPTSMPEVVRFAYLKNKASLEEMIRYFGTSLCVDPRDRIYGLLSLITWPPGETPIAADYSLSVAQLGVKTISLFVQDRDSYTPSVDFDFVGRLANALELGDSDRAWLEVNPRHQDQNQTSTSSSFGGFGGVPSEIPFVVISSVAFRLWNGFNAGRTLEIAPWEPLSCYKAAKKGLWQISKLFRNSLGDLMSKGKGTALRLGDHTIGIACSAARQGDYLVLLDARNGFGYPRGPHWLVLREGRVRWKVVGRAVAIVPCDEQKCELREHRRVDVFLTLPHLLAMACSNAWSPGRSSVMNAAWFLAQEEKDFLPCYALPISHDYSSWECFEDAESCDDELDESARQAPREGCRKGNGPVRSVHWWQFNWGMIRNGRPRQLEIRIV